MKYNKKSDTHLRGESHFLSVKTSIFPHKFLSLQCNINGITQQKKY